MTNGDTIKDTLCHAKDRLKNFGDESYDIDAKVLLKHCLDCDEMYLIIHSYDVIDDDKKKEYYSYINRRINGEPVAYITGEKEFMGYKFKVTPDVLVPRPDTETLCYEAMNCVRDKESVHILDLCTGTGCIGISLAKMIPSSIVTMVDLSLEALEIARENAIELGVDNRCEFLLIDVLNNLKDIDDKYDIVVSNPPYIRTGVIDTLMTDVKDFEPRIALDGGTDGLDFYKAIVSQSDYILKDDGVMLFEIGYDQQEEIRDIMKKDFYNVDVFYDLGENPRVAEGYKKGKNV